MADGEANDYRKEELRHCQIWCFICSGVLICKDSSDATQQCNGPIHLKLHSWCSTEKEEKWNSHLCLLVQL